MDEDERRQIRRKLRDLSSTELIQRLFLLGLVGRIDMELAAYAALFAPEGELPAGLDSEVAGLSLMFTQELKRRSAAQSKLKRLDTEGEINHADHAETNGSH